MEPKIVVLHNIPLNYSEALVTDYVEGTLDVDVEKVELVHFIPGKALVYLKEELQDLKEASTKISKAPLESKEIKLLETKKEAAVVVSGIDLHKLSKEFLCLYFEREFADGCIVTKCSCAWPDLQVAVVHFDHSQIKDLKDASTKISKALLESKEIKLLETKKEVAVVVSGIDLHKLSKEFLCLYFESEFADGHIIIKSSDAWSDLQVAVVHFDHSHIKVVEKILKQPDQVPLPSENYHISVYPFYQNFHQYIGQQITDEKKPAAAKRLASKNDSDSETEKGGSGKAEDNEGNTESEGEIGWNKMKNKNSHGESSSEEESPDSALSSRFQKEGKNLSSKMEPEVFKGGFRGKGRGGTNIGPITHTSVREMHTAPSTRGSFGTRGRGNTSVSVGIRDGSSSIIDKDVSNNDSFLGNKYKEQQQRRKSTEEEEDFKQRHNAPLNKAMRKSETLPIENRGKQHNVRGRGGTILSLSGRDLGMRVTDFRKDFDEDNENQSHSLRSNFADHDPDRDNLTYISKAGHSHSRTSLQSVESESQSLLKEDPTFKKLQNDLAAQIARIKELEKELEKKNEMSKSCMEKIDMETWQHDFLQSCFERFENCYIFFDQQKKLAILEGEPKSVKKHNLILLKELNKLKDDHLSLTSSMASILSKERGREFLQRINSSQLNGAKAYLQDKALLIAAKEESVLNGAREFFKAMLDYRETLKFDSKLPIERIEYLQTKLENELLVKVSWNGNVTEITIEGVRDDVLESVRSFNALIEEFVVNEKEFKIIGFGVKLFRNLRDKMDNILDGLEIVEMTDLDRILIIRFKGDKKAVVQAHRKLEELKTKIISKYWDLRTEFQKTEDLMLITIGFHSDKMKQKVESFQQKRNCFIVPSLPDAGTFIICASNMKKSSKYDHHSQSKHKKEHMSAFIPKPKDKLSLTITNTCKLVIKPYGDIINESSDVLVSVLDEKVDMRKTRVGQAFNKACPSLWKVLQAEHEANPNATVLTTLEKSDLKCKAICHIILTPWNPGLSSTQLTTAIQTVMNQAVTLSAKSVSFPVLGYGRAFQFPASEVAKITLASIKSSNLGSSIQKIVLLAPDTDLFTEFKKEAPNHFSAAPDKVQGTVGGASPSIIADDEEDESDDIHETIVEVPHDAHKPGNAEIKISTLNGNNLESLWSDLKNLIVKICLHTDYFNQDIAPFWPKDSKKRILQEAIKLNVWVESSPHPKKKQPGYLIKGEVANVDKIHGIIKNEFSEFSANMPKRRIRSDKAPNRGTVEFLRHAAGSDEVFPSYWKLNSPTKKRNWDKLKGIFFTTSEKSNFLVSVDTKTEDAIKKLVEKTWDPQLVGAGSDALGLTHKGIKILNIKRIENTKLFELYSAQRKSLFKKMSDAGHVCTDIGKISGSKGNVVTTQHLEDILREELYYEINEHYVFHGTKFPDAIIANGIDPKVSGERPLFGRGIYAAERFTKSDQYTDLRKQRSAPGTQLTMVLARMLLGNVFLCNDSHPSVASRTAPRLKRPPCIQCKQDLCNCSNQVLFDSVMGDGRWLFREFIVYDKDKCYPEYLITYERI